MRYVASWFKKEPVAPIPTPTLNDYEELFRAKVAKLDPNCKYLFMWEQPLNPQHVQSIRKILTEFFGERKVAVWFGVRIPEIYEFKSDEEEKECLKN